jgi:hypothetical protein
VATARSLELRRLSQRIADALLVLNELQLDTVALAPSGPNIDRARDWLARVPKALRAAAEA